MHSEQFSMWLVYLFSALKCLPYSRIKVKSREMSQIIKCANINYAKTQQTNFYEAFLLKLKSSQLNKIIIKLLEGQENKMFLQYFVFSIAFYSIFMN